MPPLPQLAPQHPAIPCEAMLWKLLLLSCIHLSMSPQGLSHWGNCTPFSPASLPRSMSWGARVGKLSPPLPSLAYGGSDSPGKGRAGMLCLCLLWLASPGPDCPGKVHPPLLWLEPHKVPFPGKPGWDIVLPSSMTDLLSASHALGIQAGEVVAPCTPASLYGWPCTWEPGWGKLYPPH